jgi:hypothetical protein
MLSTNQSGCSEERKSDSVGIVWRSILLRLQLHMSSAYHSGRFWVVVALLVRLARALLLLVDRVTSPCSMDPGLLTTPKSTDRELSVHNNIVSNHCMGMHRR